MNTDLTSLPENKRSDLQRIVALLREYCPSVGMIILYGSYARGDWKELKDLAPDRKSGHPSDYDILVILRDERDCSSTARREIDKAGAEAKLTATPRFIYHDIDYVNRKLEIGQYFFSDIVAEGKMLHDSAAFKLEEEKTLTPAERLKIARNDFEKWFETSAQFFENYKFNYSKGWLKLAAFNLHQAAESAYKTVLIVFTGYIPDEHYSACWVPRPLVPTTPSMPFSLQMTNSNTKPLRRWSTPISAPGMTSAIPLTSVACSIWRNGSKPWSG
jgi:predicted nucleotidyltransferase